MKSDKDPTGKTNNYEDAAAKLTPQEPVAKNSNTNRELGTAKISNTSDGGVQVSSDVANQGRGSAGVHLFYYKYEKCKTRSKEKRDEIISWRKYQKNVVNPKKKEQGKSNNKSKTESKAKKKTVSAAVDSAIYQLTGIGNGFYGEEKKYPSQSS